MEDLNIQDENLIDQIELHSGDVQEILSRPPKWIIRWGVSIILFVVLVILAGSYFFKYPDIISANVTLTTENPPAQIVAKASGKIQNLFVHDKSIVVKDQIVAIIENPARYEDVKKVESLFSSFKADFKQGEFFRYEKSALELGAIQAYFADFSKNIDDYNYFVKQKYYEQKIELYTQEINKYTIYIKHIKNQNNLLKNDLALNQKQFSRDSLLYNQNLLSESEFDKSKSSLLNKKYALEQNNASIASTNLQIENLKQSILESELQNEKQLSNMVYDIQESFENLIASYNNWRYQYVLVSPTNGVVTYNEYWNENQTIKTGDVLMTIIPEIQGEIVGKVKLSFDGAGKVRVGQTANIRFANYPYLEFGMVRGVVKSISLAPNNDYYTAEITLPNGLKTFYNIDLDFKQGMIGNAEIITDDVRLMERIIRPIRLILKKNTKFGEIKN